MVPRIARSVGLLLMLATTLTRQVDAQTLADAAKKAGESSAATSATSRRFTDKDLKASSSVDDGLISTSSVDADIDPPGPVLSREEIVKRVMPAVVTIQAGNGTGSGFFVGRGLV